MKEYIIEAAKTIISDIDNGNIITSVLDLPDSTQSYPSDEDGSGVVSKLMDKALRSNFNNPEELKVKKLAAATLAIAKAKGRLPESMKAQSLATLADEGISRLKVDYQVGAGIIDPNEAADKLIDQATARTAEYLKKAAPVYISKGVDIIASAVMRAFPEASPVVIMVKEPIKHVLNKTAQRVIVKGAAKVNQTAKTVIHKIITKTTTVTKSVTTTVKKFLKRFA